MIVAILVARMTTVVSPQSMPAASASASPRNCRNVVCPPRKPSLNATATAANAMKRPIHWMRFNVSAREMRGMATATTKGDV